MSSVRGAFTIAVFLANLGFWATPVILVGLFKAFLPKGEFRRSVN